MRCRWRQQVARQPPPSRPRRRSPSAARPSRADAAPSRDRPAIRRSADAACRRCGAPDRAPARPGSTPQRLPPMLISTCTGRLATPASAAAASRSAICAGSSTHTPIRRGVRQRHQPAQFLPADDLVGDEHVAHAAIDHRLGLADLLHADADRAQLDLLQRDDRAFVRLGVRPQPHPAARRPGRRAASDCARTRRDRRSAPAYRPRRATCRSRRAGGWSCQAPQLKSNSADLLSLDRNATGAAAWSPELTPNKGSN